MKSETDVTTNLVKTYIRDIYLNDIFYFGTLVEAAKVLLDLQEKYQEKYVNITFDFDKNNDTFLEVYGYREETEKEIKKRNAEVLTHQEEDYKLYLELKQRFEDFK
jgi:flavoprotein